MEINEDGVVKKTTKKKKKRKKKRNLVEEGLLEVEGSDVEASGNIS